VAAQTTTFAWITGLRLTARTVVAVATKARRVIEATSLTRRVGMLRIHAQRIK
jgi:hypothetical protein